jgi:Tol biopolymer transport system component
LRSPRLIVVFLVLICAAMVPASAQAAYPLAQNGRIVFDREVNGKSHIFVMNADGSNPVDLSPASTFGDSSPQFSPNGKSIAFTRQMDSTGGLLHVFRMQPDGSGATDITPGLQGAGEPTFSPDGKQIAFIMDTNPDLNSGLYSVSIMNADGSGITDLTPNSSEFELRPDFSPDGSRLIFERDDPNPVLFSMAPDGSGQTRLTPSGQIDVSAAFSPAGSQVAWSRSAGMNDFDIFLGDPSLGGATDITPGGSGPAFKQEPSFSPDASKIAFHAYQGMGSQFDIFVMGATGSPPPMDISPAANPTDRDPHWEYVYMCAKRRATIVGDDGPETIKGTKKADVIVGNGGNDKIKGKGGNDRICGGRGKDTLIGGPGAKDRLVGGPGKDKEKQ